MLLLLFLEIVVRACLICPSQSSRELTLHFSPLQDTVTEILGVSQEELEFIVFLSG